MEAVRWDALERRFGDGRADRALSAWLGQASSPERLNRQLIEAIRAQILKEASEAGDPALADPLNLAPERLRWLEGVAYRTLVRHPRAGLPDPATVRLYAMAAGGLGRLTPLWQDPSVTDVLVADPVVGEKGERVSRVWIGVEGGPWQPTDLWLGEEEARALVQTLAELRGLHLDERSPSGVVDLPGGQRILLMIPPRSPGWRLVARRRGRRRLGREDFVPHVMPPWAYEYLLRVVVGARTSLFLFGPPGAGKTALLDHLLSLLPEEEVVAVIADVDELTADLPGLLRLRVPRTPEAYRAALEDALRLRAHRLVFPEALGGEMAAVVEAAAAFPVWATAHADDPRAALTRALAAAGRDPVARAQREEMDTFIRLGFNVIVLLGWVGRQNDRRVVRAIYEQDYVPGEAVALGAYRFRDVLRLEGVDEEGRPRWIRGEVFTRGHTYGVQSRLMTMRGGADLISPLSHQEVRLREGVLRARQLRVLGRDEEARDLLQDLLGQIPEDVAGREEAQLLLAQVVERLEAQRREREAETEALLARAREERSPTFLRYVHRELVRIWGPEEGERRFRKAFGEAGAEAPTPSGDPEGEGG